MNNKEISSLNIPFKELYADKLKDLILHGVWILCNHNRAEFIQNGNDCE